MSVKTDVLQEIAKRSGIDFEELQTALSSEDEQTLELSDVEVFTPDEMVSFKKNVGTAAVEIAVKEFKRKNAIDFSGKTLSGLAEHYKTLGMKEGQKEPEQQYKELQDKYTLLMDEKDNLSTTIDNYEGKMFNLTARTQLKSAIDTDTTLSKDDLIVLFENKHEYVKGDDGELYVKKRGASDVIQDKRLNPIKAADVIKEFANPFVKKPSGTPPGHKPKPSDDMTFAKQSDYNDWEEGEEDQALKSKVLADSLKKHGQEFYK